MRLLGDRVLLKRDDVQEERRGLIYIPAIARSKPQEATVVSVGDKCQTVKVGDRVLFGRYSVLEVGEYGAVIRERDIMGILTP